MKRTLLVFLAFLGVSFLYAPLATAQEVASTTFKEITMSSVWYQHMMIFNALLMSMIFVIVSKFRL